MDDQSAEMPEGLYLSLSNNLKELFESQREPAFENDPDEIEVEYEEPVRRATPVRTTRRTTPVRSTSTRSNRRDGKNCYCCGVFYKYEDKYKHWDTQVHKDAWAIERGNRRRRR